MYLINDQHIILIFRHMAKVKVLKIYLLWHSIKRFTSVLLTNYLIFCTNIYDVKIFSKIQNVKCFS